MKYCPQCAVEIEDRLRHCPLCDEVLQEEVPEVCGEFPGIVPPEEQVTNIPKGVKRTWTLLGITISSFLAMMICTIVDIRISPELDWSWYVNFSIFAAVCILAVTFYLVKRPIAMFTGIWLVATVLAVAIDSVSAPLTWSMAIALPVSAMVLVLFGTWLYLMVRNRYQPVTVIVSGLGVITLFCAALDYHLSQRIAESLPLSWSIPVFVSLTLIATGLIATVQILKKNRRWSRFFEH